MTISEILLEITPPKVKCVTLNHKDYSGYLEISLPNTRQNTSPSWGYSMKSPHPTRSLDGFMSYLHECAHAHLDHFFKKTPTYYQEIQAWAQVGKWIKKYNINITTETLKTRTARSLGIAWKRKRTHGELRTAWWKKTHYQDRIQSYRVGICGKSMRVNPFLNSAK